jgi:hypothetical protein
LSTAKNAFFVGHLREGIRLGRRLRLGLVPAQIELILAFAVARAIRIFDPLDRTRHEVLGIFPAT